MMRLGRRPTIISPTSHIRSYNFRPFLALILTGLLLSIIAGYINTICLVGYFKTSVSASTGSTSKLVISLGDGKFGEALHFFILIFSFLLGSFTSAALVGGSSFRIQRSYGLVLLLESFALVFGYLYEVSCIVKFIQIYFNFFVAKYYRSYRKYRNIKSRRLSSFSCMRSSKWHVYDILRCSYSHDTRDRYYHRYWSYLRTSIILSSNSKTSLEIKSSPTIVRRFLLGRSYRIRCISIIGYESNIHTMCNSRNLWYWTYMLL